MNLAVRAALLLLGATVAALLLVDDRARSFGLCTALVLSATAAQMVLLRVVLQGGWRPGLGSLCLYALILRLLCFGLTPSLSDDIHRYQYEGRLVLDGINPYLTAPEDAPAEYRDATWERINNPDIPAAYPPAVQYALALGWLVHPSPWGMKLVFGLCDLLCLPLLWLLLRASGRRPELALVHALCPLLAIEFAGEGHSDSLAVLALLAACLAVQRANLLGAGASLAVATAAKLMPAVLLPFALRAAWRRGGGRCAALLGGAFAATLALLYLRFVPGDDPMQMFRGTLEYTARWRSNDSLFGVVHWLTEQAKELGWLGDQEVQRAAKRPLAALAGVVLAWAWWRRLPLERVALCFFLFFVAFAPTLHPWYLAFLAPFVAFAPRPPWVLFFGTAYLAYHVLPGWLDNQEWQEQGWVQVLEYLPFYLGFLWPRRPDEMRVVPRGPGAPLLPQRTSDPEN